jgi:hypothetical protein
MLRFEVGGSPLLPLLKVVNIVTDLGTIISELLM